MKRNKMISFVLALIMVVGFLFVNQTEVNAASKKMALSAKKITLTVGQSKRLTLSNAKKVKWTSSKKTVASVSSKGKVTGKKAGKAIITATASGKKFKCSVVVKKVTNTKPSNQEQINQQPSDQEQKLLVAYFSWSGTSERIAKNIIAQTGADSFRIERAVPYSTDYTETAYGDAQVEAQTNARPAIKDPLPSVTQYDKIVLCYPIWWHTAPMTVGTFLESYDLTGKTIYPVSQSASMDVSQYEESVAFIRSCSKGATVDDGIFTKNNEQIQNYVNNTVLKDK